MQTCPDLKIRFIILLSLTLWSFVTAVAQSDDKAKLLTDVNGIPMPYPPNYVCAIYAINDIPQIIATAELGQGNPSQVITIATSRLGKGKIVIFGSAWYFREPLLRNIQVRQVLLNTLNWSGIKRSGIQIYGKESQLKNFLNEEKMDVLESADFISPATSTLILTTDVKDEKKLKSLEKFIFRGGTLIFGSPISDDINKSEPEIYDLKVNRILKKAGLSHQPVAALPDSGVFELIIGATPAYLQISNILQQFENRDFVPDPKELESYNDLLRIALISNPSGSAVVKRIRAAFDLDDAERLVPSPDTPIAKEHVRSYMAYSLNLWFKRTLLAEKPDPYYIAPASRDFPGKVPLTAKRISTTISVQPGLDKRGDGGYRRWHSTGLYVPAGEVVKVRVSASDSNKRLSAQIGAHNDRLDHMNVLKREADDLTRSFELSKRETKIYSPYGGILMINLPDTSSLKSLDLEVKGAIAYPFFRSGKTDIGEWKNSIRNYPAPWAELASDKIILTVPAERIRELDDPEKVLEFWDAVVDTQDSLAHFHSRTYPERIIVDQQVAWGYMFAQGYKIVVPNDGSTKNMLDHHFLWKNGSWGHFHELGHRHQLSEIDFGGVGEVTVNLFTMYAFDKLLKKGLYNHPNIPSKEAVINKIKKYMSSSDKGTSFTSDPFIALCMYIQLIEGFGWDPISKVYQKYRELPKEQYPVGEQAKRDFWFVSICEATKKDLSTFFDRWNLSPSKAAREKVLSHEFWLPEELR